MCHYAVLAVLGHFVILFLLPERHSQCRSAQLCMGEAPNEADSLLAQGSAVNVLAHASTCCDVCQWGCWPVFKP